MQLLFQSTYFDDKRVNKFYNSYNLERVRDFFDNLQGGASKKKLLYLSLHENNLTAILNLLGYLTFEELEKRVLGQKVT